MPKEVKKKEKKEMAPTTRDMTVNLHKALHKI